MTDDKDYKKVAIKLYNEVRELQLAQEVLIKVIFGDEDTRGMIESLDPYYVGAWDSELAPFMPQRESNSAPHPVG